MFVEENSVCFEYSDTKKNRPAVPSLEDLNKDDSHEYFQKIYGNPVSRTKGPQKQRVDAFIKKGPQMFIAGIDDKKNPFNSSVAPRNIPPVPPAKLEPQTVAPNPPQNKGRIAPPPPPAKSPSQDPAAKATNTAGITPQAAKDVKADRDDTEQRDRYKRKPRQFSDVLNTQVHVAPRTLLGGSDIAQISAYADFENEFLKMMRQQLIRQT